jgi:uncharacterized membrane protein
MRSHHHVALGVLALVVVVALVALGTWWRAQDRKVVDEATRVLPISRDQEPPR